MSCFYMFPFAIVFHYQHVMLSLSGLKNGFIVLFVLDAELLSYSFLQNR